MGGTPARPFKEWARELAAIRRLAKNTPAMPERED
jgi:UDP-3-O-[3-hydroxymyristoyl] glucosamine N-acyltransferase